MTALHLEDEGRITGLDKTLWQQFMSKDNLYSNHWLLAYEASVKRWLNPPRGRDFTQADEFFKILRAHDVSFYDVTATDVDVESEYDDDVLDDSDVEPDTEEDDDGETDTGIDFQNPLF